jgi:electron transfer flavoprotein alpha subunit
VAARLGLGLTGDCLDVEWDEAGRLRQLKPAFGDSVVAPIYSRTSPVLATVRPGVLRPVRPDPGRRARPSGVREMSLRSGDDRTRILARTPDEDGAGAALGRAPVIVAVGAGVGPPEGYGPVWDLADLLGAPVGASRKVTDRGWLPRARQIGLTGRTVAPRYYFAIGIRGVSHHAVGIRRAGTVVAINDSESAPIWKLCDLGIRGDWAAVVPALTRALQDLRPRP